MLHAVVDTKNRPIYVALTPDQRHEMITAEELLENAREKALIGDTGSDSKDARQAVRAKQMRAVIGSKPNRLRKLPKIRRLYAKRYLVEVFFHNLKRFRAIATRYEKITRNYLALVRVSCARIWLKTRNTSLST